MRQPFSIGTACTRHLRPRTTKYSLRQRRDVCVWLQVQYQLREAANELTRSVDNRRSRCHDWQTFRSGSFVLNDDVTNALIPHLHQQVNAGSRRSKRGSFMTDPIHTSFLRAPSDATRWYPTVTAQLHPSPLVNEVGSCKRNTRVRSEVLNHYLWMCSKHTQPNLLRVTNRSTFLHAQPCRNILSRHVAVFCFSGIFRGIAPNLSRCVMSIWMGVSFTQHRCMSHDCRSCRTPSPVVFWPMSPITSLCILWTLLAIFSHPRSDQCQTIQCHMPGALDDSLTVSLIARAALIAPHRQIAASFQTVFFCRVLSHLLCHR